MVGVPPLEFPGEPLHRRKIYGNMGERRQAALLDPLGVARLRENHRQAETAEEGGDEGRIQPSLLDSHAFPILGLI